MGLVICPDCGEKISEHSEICIKCGFPLQKFLKEHNITNVSGVLVCPKCAKVYNGWNMIRYDLPQHLKCKYCGTIVVQTNKDIEEIYKLGCKLSDEDFNQIKINLAKEFGNNQFDEKAFNHCIQAIDEEIQDYIKQIDSKNQQSQQSNQPKCPTCGSTNIEKISTAKKAAGGFMFGLFSKTAKSQFACKDCGYKW